ncbi:MAG: NAD-dependent epimerase/dehydratase family protein [Bacteroidia bacterium]
MIVVSGATGFLGAYMVCHLLEKGKQVKALRRPVSSTREFNTIFNHCFESLPDSEKSTVLKRLEWVNADVLDIVSLEEAMTGADEVYHCAAIVSFQQKHKKRLMQVNVEGTTNMVNAALHMGIKRFCHVSSTAALGREHSGDHMDEKSKWLTSSLNTNYAISKHKAEVEVWRGMEEGLNAVIVNPGVILGAGDWNKGSCKLFTLPWKNFPFYTTGINGYVDVRDVASAMYQLMQTESASGQRYVLVSNNMNMEFFMHTAAAWMNKTKARFRVKPWMAEVAWMLFAVKQLITGKEASITRETARASMNHYYYSSAKILTQTGFTFIPIEETLQYICQKFIKDQRR